MQRDVVVTGMGIVCCAGKNKGGEVIKTLFPINMDITKVRIRIYNKGSIALIPSFPNKFQMGVNLPKGGSRKIRKIPIEKYVTQISEVVPEAKK